MVRIKTVEGGLHAAIRYIFREKCAFGRAGGDVILMGVPAEGGLHGTIRYLRAIRLIFGEKGVFGRAGGNVIRMRDPAEPEHRNGAGLGVFLAKRVRKRALPAALDNSR